MNCCHKTLFNSKLVMDYLCQRSQTVGCTGGIAAKKIIYTVKILKIGTPEIITIIVLQLEQLGFTVQYCAQKMQTE